MRANGAPGPQCIPPAAWPASDMGHLGCLRASFTSQMPMLSFMLSRATALQCFPGLYFLFAALLPAVHLYKTRKGRTFPLISKKNT